jgi:peptidyl-prolyl cis-trans isomerase D
VQSAAAVERNATNVPAPLLTQAFLLPHPAAGKAVFAAVDMHDGSFAVLALDKVQPGDLSKVTAEQRKSLRQQMAQAYAVEATRELVDTLRAQTKIKYNKTLM